MIYSVEIYNGDMKKSLFITFPTVLSSFWTVDWAPWSLAPIARSSKAFCHIDFLSHLWWETLGTWMRNWATSCLGWTQSCWSCSPWPSLAPPKTLNHKQIEQHGTTITNHVSVLKEHGFTFGTSFFVDTPSSPTSCRSFSSGMSTPHWWATGEQWAHALPKDLLGNLCTWAPWVVRLGVECRCMG